MFSFFRKKPPAAAPAEPAAPVAPAGPHDAPAPAAPAGGLIGSAVVRALDVPATPAPSPAPAAREGWLQRLSSGLRKTGSGFTQVFTGARVDESL